MDASNRRHQREGDALDCADCRHELQDYLDGTLEKKGSLAVFLHLRECEPCRREHDALRAVFTGLESLPAPEAPADFDAVVLATVPLAAYQAMASLRRDRVPVYLEDGFVPAWLRARTTRVAGLVTAATSLTVWLALPGPAWLVGVAVGGAVPELVVRLQGVGRRLVDLRRAEG